MFSALNLSQHPSTNITTAILLIVARLSQKHAPASAKRQTLASAKYQHPPQPGIADSIAVTTITITTLHSSCKTSVVKQSKPNATSSQKQENLESFRRLQKGN